MALPTPHYSFTRVVNDDGSTMTSFIESGDFDIGDGDDIMFVNKVIPDFKDQEETLMLALNQVLLQIHRL